MNLPDKCPFCGAGIVVMENGEKCVSENWVAFQCITSIHVGQDIRRTQSRGCETNERGRLTARVTELEARIKRLETAARDLYLDCIASGARWTKQQTKHMHALRDVLEAKP